MRLNQEGKEVDCYLDPTGKEEVKFHRVGGIAGATMSLAFFGFTCFALCCCPLLLALCCSKHCFEQQRARDAAARGAQL